MEWNQHRRRGGLVHLVVDAEANHGGILTLCEIREAPLVRFYAVYNNDDKENLFDADYMENIPEHIPKKGTKETGQSKYML